MRKEKSIHGDCNDDTFSKLSQTFPIAISLISLQMVFKSNTPVISCYNLWCVKRVIKLNLQGLEISLPLHHSCGRMNWVFSRLLLTGLHNSQCYLSTFIVLILLFCCYTQILPTRVNQPMLQYAVGLIFPPFNHIANIIWPQLRPAMKRWLASSPNLHLHTVQHSTMHTHTHIQRIQKGRKLIMVRLRQQCETSYRFSQWFCSRQSLF